MKWYAISGSWRTIDEKVKEDVEKIVKEIISNNNGILTGGALGVDYIATQTVLDLGDLKRQLKVYLPISLEKFCEYYHDRAKKGIITEEQSNQIVSQLKRIKEESPFSILDDWGYKKVNKTSYYGRNTRIIEDCDELYAFQVNDSKGIQDAINKAKKKGKTAHLKKYYTKTEII